MTEDFVPLRYAYQNALREALTAFTERKETADGSAFLYRGANLRYALERILFPRLTQHENLFALFCASKKNGRAVGIVEDAVEKEIALLLCGADAQIRVKSGGGRAAFKRLAYRLGARPAKRMLRLLRTLVNRARRSPRADILFYAINEQFARYAKPVARALPISFAYASFSPPVRAYLAETGSPYAASSVLGSRIARFSDASSVLEEYGLDRAYDLALECLDWVRPKRIVVFEGCSYMDEIMNRAGRARGIPCICIQHGWVGIKELWTTELHFSKMLVWGAGFDELLAPDNPHQRFVSVGNFAVAAKRLPKERLPGANLTLGFFLQKKSGLLDEHRLRAFKELALWAARTFPSLTVVVRTHPAATASEGIDSREKNLVLMPPQTHRLEDMLRVIDVSFSIYSSTILESIEAGRLPVIVNIVSLPSYQPDLARRGAAIETKSIEETKEVIRKLAEGVLRPDAFIPALNKAREDYFAAGGEDAIRNIVRELTN